MMEFKVVPLSLEIRGIKFKRGEFVYFDAIFRNGTKKPLQYRLWNDKRSHYAKNHKWEWFTLKQLDGMQPHWLTQQEEFRYGL